MQLGSGPLRGARSARGGVLVPVLRLVALGWIVAGLVGTYSYLQNYNLTRGFAAPVRLAQRTPRPAADRQLLLAGAPAAGRLCRVPTGRL